MSTPYIGEIRLIGCNFAPQGWSFCNGQLISISQNTALFQLLGTTYGGDGVNTFALPNLQSRVPINQGQGPGLSNRVIGETGGAEAVTVSTAQLPQHTHVANCNSGSGTSTNPANNFWAAQAALLQYTAGGSENTTMKSNALGLNANGGQSHDNMVPYLAMNYVIALEGIYPSQN